MAKTNLINGQWRVANGDEFQSSDPFDDQPIWNGRESSSADVHAAVEAARQVKDEWALRTFEERESILLSYAKLLEAAKPELATLISREVGKPLWESAGEAGAMAGKVAISIKAFHDRCGTSERPAGDAVSVTRFRPHGVVGVFGPFNFPGHLPNGHIVPALLAGNTVVFKPSEMAPAVGTRMVQLLAESGIPAGVVNLVQGGRQSGIDLANESGLDGLFFTGSSAAGKAIHRQYGGAPEKILALEMGGNNPLIVHDVKDVDAAVYWTIQSAYITAGQRCVCARRLIVTDGERADEFVQKLVESLPKIGAGHYSDDPEPFLGPVISGGAAERVLREQQTLIDGGAKSLVACERSPESAALLNPGLVDSTNAKNVSDEEIFGPLLQLVRVPTFDAAIEEANRTAYGLAAGLLTPRREDYDYFFERIRAGIVNWNKPTTGASSAAPFGGIGQSGNHNPSAYFAADYCSYPVASMECGELRKPDAMSPGLDL